LTTSPELDCGPTFSPDGRRIAYTSVQATVPGYARILTMRADGGDKTPITNGVEDDSRNGLPTGAGFRSPATPTRSPAAG
jgi:Tol biopolymer transport system component